MVSLDLNELKGIDIKPSPPYTEVTHDPHTIHILHQNITWSEAHFTNNFSIIIQIW